MPRFPGIEKMSCRIYLIVIVDFYLSDFEILIQRDVNQRLPMPSAKRDQNINSGKTYP